MASWRLDRSTPPASAGHAQGDVVTSSTEGRGLRRGQVSLNMLIASNGSSWPPHLPCTNQFCHFSAAPVLRLPLPTRSTPFLASMFTHEPFPPSWELSEASAAICWEGSVTTEGSKPQPRGSPSFCELASQLRGIQIDKEGKNKLRIQCVCVQRDALVCV